jgi:hypothetical protein
MLRQHAPRFLDEPYLVDQLDIARATHIVAHLASRGSSRLPERLRHRLHRIARQLAAIKAELHGSPDTIKAERQREEQRASRRRPLAE